MKLPIPNDWDGQDWLCVEVHWPNSPQWLGVLSGALTAVMRGRLWDENTGSILDVLDVGFAIHDRNFPFVLCGDCDSDPVVVDQESSGQVIAVFERMCDVMSLCGYNPKAFKIQDGSLWVKDFCGEWVEIGALSSTEVVSDDTIPDPPPNDYVDSTACAMASKLAVFVQNIVINAWAELAVGAVVDIYDFVSDMRDKFPGIDLGYNDLINLYFNMVPLNAAGLENETKNPEIVEWLSCQYVDEITASNSGVTQAEYEALKGATTSALKLAVGDSTYSGFGKTIRYVWEFAFKAIGAGDAQKITYYVQPTGLEDCSCPGGPELRDIIGPTDAGWYFSEPYVETETFPDGFDYGFASRYEAIQHHVYGVMFEFEWLSGQPINRIKRSNDPEIANPGFYMFGSNSDSLNELTQYLGATQTIFDAMSSLFSNPVRLDYTGKSSETVNSPVASVGTVVEATIAAQAVSGGIGTMDGKVTIRWLHNDTDDSH